MKLWVDAQLSPAVARWMSAELGVEAIALRDLGMRDATDTQIWEYAKANGFAIVSKDSDFQARSLLLSVFLRGLRSHREGSRKDRKDSQRR